MRARIESRKGAARRAAGYCAKAPLDVWQACDHLNRMSKMVQIRNVPDALHRRLKARAGLEGKSLSDYLLAEIAESAERPTVGELRARLAGRSAVSPARKPALVLREERDTR